MEANKDRLLLAIFLLVTNLCLAQKGTINLDSLKKGGIYVGDGSGLGSTVLFTTHIPRVDTVKAIMLVSDTSNFASRYPFTVKGYIAISNWNVYSYLDQWKKPLPKYYMVWLSNSIIRRE